MKSPPSIFIQGQLLGIGFAEPSVIWQAGLPNRRQKGLRCKGSPDLALTLSQSPDLVRSRQLLVTVVDAGSPTDGILAVNDVSLGGKGISRRGFGDVRCVGREHRRGIGLITLLRHRR